MTGVITVPLLAVCLLAAGGSTLAAARDWRPSNRLLIVLIVLELLVLAQLVVALVELAVGHRPAGTLIFLLYATFELLVVPVGVFWSSAEQSRSSTLVITVACAAVAVMTLRMVQIWSGTHA